MSSSQEIQNKMACWSEYPLRLTSAYSGHKYLLRIILNLGSSPLFTNLCCLALLDLAFLKLYIISQLISAQHFLIKSFVAHIFPLIKSMIL